MTFKHMLLGVAMLMPGLAASAQGPLTGTIIGTTLCHDYERNTSTTTVNTAANLFDGNPDTFFATEARSYTWAGLDLGTPHVITRVGWMPRNDGVGPGRVQLGVFQGANSEDFLDAVPLHIITSKGTIGLMSTAEVKCERSFRYVRYVGPSDARCNIAELQFYGHEDADATEAPVWQVTNLPTVAINTVNSQEPYDKEHDIPGKVVIISEQGTEILLAEAEVRERGNASREFPKKPWRIKFDSKQKPLGAPAKAKKWTLINNYGDKTLMRNRLAFDIARKMDMEYVPFCEFVDVILNGEYKGTYQLSDQIEVGDGRVEIDEMEPEDITGEALTGGYFVEADAYAYSEPSMFETSYYRIPFTIKSPDEDEIKPEQSNYIRAYFNNLESRLRSGSFTDASTGYRKIFDTGSFIRHMLVNEMAGNTDAYWSTYMYKHRGDEVIYTGPVWDFDLSFHNDARTYPITTNAANTYLWNSGRASFANGMDRLVKRIILEDGATKAEIAAIWNYARNQRGMTAEWLKSLVDEYAARLALSQNLNFMRWPIMNERVHQNPYCDGSYTAECERIRKYVDERMAQLDRIIGYEHQENALDALTPADEQLPATYFNLQGIRVDNPQPGMLLIERRGTATRKIVI